jgi:hypothetical protein
VRPQRRRIGRGHDRKVEVLPEVVRDAVEAVDPLRAHRARMSLRFPVHQVVDDERPVGAREQLTCPCPSCGRELRAAGEVLGTFSSDGAWLTYRYPLRCVVSVLALH